MVWKGRDMMTEDSSMLGRLMLLRTDWELLVCLAASAL